MSDASLNRRSFLKRTGQSLALLSLRNDLTVQPFTLKDTKPISITDPNPISNISKSTFQDLSSTDFNGDDIDRSHEALWNINGYIRDRQKDLQTTATESADLVIVGGGISGLLCGYYAHKKNPNLKIIILEMGTSFGGNSRGEYLSNSSSPNNLKSVTSKYLPDEPRPDGYSIGAAYITKPDPNSEAEFLLKDLGLYHLAKSEGSEDSKIFYKNKFYSNFWEGSTNPQALMGFTDIYNKLKWILENEYPEIPPLDNETVSQKILELDQISFLDWLNQNFRNIPTEVLEYFQLYCWSSFNGSIDEISAAQALNFIAAETDDVWAFPGGNAAITQNIYDYLIKNIGQEQLRAGSIVLDVQLNENTTRDTFSNKISKIIYETPQRKLKQIISKKVIIATPKFIAKKIVSSMPSDQIEACEKITYRPYIVANIFLDKNKILNWNKNSNTESPCFDLYCLNGSVPKTPSALKPPAIAFTDICFSNWSYSLTQEADSRYLKLTVYKPLPYQGARQFLFNPLIHNRYKNVIIENVKPLLNELKISDECIAGIRLTRWGHSMPLAEVGALSKKTLSVARRNISQTIYFANQDNWVNPSFETALSVAKNCVDHL